MLGALDTVGMLERTTLAEVHLYAVNLEVRGADGADERTGCSPFSSVALGEFDAAMADIEALLARSSVRLAEAAEEDAP
ncbi:hypothetical protein [Novosphingobium sp. KN65.2]|uniref:hypothetical protein n=1 Tax=Novosphingobium sp. KN65.2 TaxID=1478134 RepID=UPI0005E1CBEB|nr:hypothetical protein [Novosphingobium sp. KN65.2]CDO38821.1 hypothetical protein SPHV1_760022 [Novosphingobium sp. KN65.2]